MAFSDRVNEAPREVIHGDPCSVCALLESLPEDERTALNDLMYETRPNSSKWVRPQSVMWELIRAEGHTVGYSTINKHRSWNCRTLKAKKAEAS